MAVRAKFKVDSVTNNEHGGSVKLTPVTTGGAENESFFKWTPWGSIEMGTVNEEALKQFTPGAEFYIDFTKADADTEAAA
jgi:hypothetical protein